MNESSIYGRLASTLIANDTNINQKPATSLLLTTGIANRYSKGDISRDEALHQIGTIIKSFPDSHGLKSISDAINGSSNLATTKFDSILDKSFQTFGIVAAPMFATPVGAITVATASLLGPDLVRYLADPNNVLSGQFAPRRPDPIRLAGAIAMEQLNQFIKDKTDLAEIYRNSGIPVLSETSVALGLGAPNPIQSLANSLEGELSDAIKLVINADSVKIKDVIAAFEKDIYERMDELGETTEQILQVLTHENKIKEQQNRVEELRRKEQLIHQEISGAITIIDAFTSLVFGVDSAKKVTGCLNATHTAMQLFSGFALGTLGPLGFAGGMVSVFQSVFGLFSGGVSDPMIEQLRELDKKLDRMTQIMIDGFEHLDKRLVDVLNLSQTILKEVLDSKRVILGKLRDIERKTDRIRALTAAIGRAQHEVPIEALKDEIRARITNGENILPFMSQWLSILVTSARSARRPEMNGWVGGLESATLSELLEETQDIRYVLGNLQESLALVNHEINLEDNRLPDVRHWSTVTQGMLELLVLTPDAEFPIIPIFLNEFWDEGAAIRSSVLVATSTPLLLDLLNIYESTLVRERSNYNVPRTLDEEISLLLARPLAASQDLSGHIVEAVSTISPLSIFNIGSVFRYLVSILRWRSSNLGDDLSIKPITVDLVADKSSLISYLVEVLAREEELDARSQKIGIVEERNGQILFRSAVTDQILNDFREKSKADLDRLRIGIPDMAGIRRVRDIDEAMYGIAAIAKSRGIALKDLNAPLFGIIPTDSGPKSFYEVSALEFVKCVQDLCKASTIEFNSHIGNIFDPTTGLRTASPLPLGLKAFILPTGVPNNPDGFSTHARFFLPTPLNRLQGMWQRDGYADLILKCFPKISRYNVLLPRYVLSMDASLTLEMEIFYYSRPIGLTDDPSEIALIYREIKGESSETSVGRTRFTIEIIIFTRKSGPIRRDI